MIKRDDYWYEWSLPAGTKERMAAVTNHALGRAGEELAPSELSRLPECELVERRTVLLPDTEHVPFDLIAASGGEFWLIEVKTRHGARGLPEDPEPQRMARLCELIEARGYRVTPLVLQQDVDSEWSGLRDYPTTKVTSTVDDDLPRIADRVVEWIQANPSR